MARRRNKPSKVIVRSYQVGFGDCFLVSFEYDESPRTGTRHVLIDFGSTALPPKTRGRKSLKQIATEIKRVTGGKLHAVVATHRHKDHIAGFQGAAGDIIAAMKPEVVLQPWTEDPKAAKDATRPGGRARLRGLHVLGLAEMQGVAAAALREVRRRNPELAQLDDGEDHEDPSEVVDSDPPESLTEGTAFTRTVAKQLAFLGEDNISNGAAVKNLMKMGKKRVYAHAGGRSGLESVLPGVKIHVLGPPTLDQSEKIKSQRHEDPNEFWHFQAQAGRRAASGSPLFPDATVVPQRDGHLPIETRWFLPRLNRIRGEQLLEIVRSLDESLNNTSLILLFEVGRKKLLFAGDAQIENWEYSLHASPNKAKIRRLLKKVDFYKVGHHGSLNATPKTLWNLFDKRDAQANRNRLSTMVSTMKGKHGSASRNTEVPRKKLVEALKKETDYLTTESLTKKTDFCQIQELKP